MKIKSILITGLILASAINCFAQDKQTPTPPVKQVPAKPVYSISPNKQFNLSAVFTVEQIGDFVTVLSVGIENVKTSDQISAKMASKILSNYQMVGDSISKRLQHFITLDRAAWAADTAKAAKKK